MNKSESITALATSLAKAQAVMENASKDTANPFFKSKYANLESVVGVIRPAIEKFGLSFVQICHDWDVGAKVETIILHESGEWLSCGIMSAPATKADAQGFGSALTYARRYSLSAAFGVATEDDDGNAASKNKPKEVFKSEPKSEWDKLDAKTQEWMTNEAMAITVMTADGDIEGAYHHLEALDLDADYKVAFWSRLDSSQRSAIKAYSGIVHAASIDGLARAWAAVPKAAQAGIEAAKDKRKAELTQLMEAAA